MAVFPDRLDFRTKHPLMVGWLLDWPSRQVTVALEIFTNEYEKYSYRTTNSDTFFKVLLITYYHGPKVKISILDFS